MGASLASRDCPARLVEVEVASAPDRLWRIVDSLMGSLSKSSVAERFNFRVPLRRTQFSLPDEDCMLPPTSFTALGETQSQRKMFMYGTSMIHRMFLMMITSTMSWWTAAMWRSRFTTSSLNSSGVACLRKVSRASERWIFPSMLKRSRVVFSGMTSWMGASPASASPRRRASSEAPSYLPTEVSCPTTIGRTCPSGKLSSCSGCVATPWATSGTAVDAPTESGALSPAGEAPQDDPPWRSAWGSSVPRISSLPRRPLPLGTPRVLRQTDSGGSSQAASPERPHHAFLRLPETPRRRPDRPSGRPPVERMAHRGAEGPPPRTRLSHTVSPPQSSPWTGLPAPQESSLGGQTSGPPDCASVSSYP
eukprot:scaffold7381_cov310-Pinguiococcus_pyrenoidosus.AAC.63